MNINIMYIDIIHDCPLKSLVYSTKYDVVKV